MALQENDDELESLDIRLHTPCTFILCGPSGAGKTTTLYNLILYGDLVFDNPSFLQYVVYFYRNVHSILPMKKMLENHPFIKQVEFINHCPTGDELEEKITPWSQTGGSTVIVDDYGADLPKSVAEYFTSYSHHHHSVGFFLTQNLFPNGDHYRLMSRNAKHILIFKFERDNSQFLCFARQVAPGKKAKYLEEVFEHAVVNRNFSYLWFDFHQRTHPYLRLKSDFTPPEWPILLFKRKQK